MEEHPDRTRGRAGNDTGAGESYAMDDIQSVSSRRVVLSSPSPKLIPPRRVLVPAGSIDQLRSRVHGRAFWTSFRGISSRSRLPRRTRKVQHRQLASFVHGPFESTFESLWRSRRLGSDLSWDCEVGEDTLVRLQSFSLRPRR